MKSVADRLADCAIWVGRIGAWASVPLMVIILLDVITRRFLVLGSIKFQEAEWYLHTVIFTTCIGFAYVRNSHVRIDLVREMLTGRRQLLIEIFGFFIFLLPFCGVIFYVSADFAWDSYQFAERSASPGGLAYRWVIKAAIPLGVLMLLFAGIAEVIRAIEILRQGPGSKGDLHRSDTSVNT